MYGADGVSPCLGDVAVGRGGRDLAAGDQTDSVEMPCSFSISFHSSLPCLGMADKLSFSCDSVLQTTDGQARASTRAV